MRPRGECAPWINDRDVITHCLGHRDHRLRDMDSANDDDPQRRVLDGDEVAVMNTRLIKPKCALQLRIGGSARHNPLLARFKMGDERHRPPLRPRRKKLIKDSALHNFSPSPLAGEGGAKRRMRGRFSESNRQLSWLNRPHIRLAAQGPQSTVPHEGGRGRKVVLLMMSPAPHKHRSCRRRPTPPSRLSRLPRQNAALWAFRFR